MGLYSGKLVLDKLPSGVKKTPVALSFLATAKNNNSSGAFLEKSSSHISSTSAKSSYSTKSASSQFSSENTNLFF